METKIVYAASKGSYGAGFFHIFDTLDELKKKIVAQEEQFERTEHEEYTDDMYTEELFKKWAKDKEYELYEINLHEDEEIVFDEYDGQSWFSIVKIEPNTLSTVKEIESYRVTF
jgi:hypothetical protein